MNGNGVDVVCVEARHVRGGSEAEMKGVGWANDFA